MYAHAMVSAVHQVSESSRHNNSPLCDHLIWHSESGVVDKNVV